MCSMSFCVRDKGDRVMPDYTKCNKHHWVKSLHKKILVKCELEENHGGQHEHLIVWDNKESCFS